MKDQDFKRKFQIGDSGISHDFFNNILGMVHPEVLRDPKRYGYTDERIHRRIKDNVPVTYTVYIEEVVENHNSPRLGFDGKIYATTDCVCIGDFIDDTNEGVVKKLDEAVRRIQKLTEKPMQEIDFEQLIDSMYNASLLIYGPKSEEMLKSQFYSD